MPRRKISELDLTQAPQASDDYVLRRGNANYRFRPAFPYTIIAYGAATTNTAAQNDTAIAAAVAGALAAGAELFWPPGTYLTSATIPSLHSVRHRGPGKIQRGSDVWAPDPQPGNTNTLYVATTGSASADGLSASQPMSTVQIGVNAWQGYGPYLRGAWVISVAAGTYTNQAVEIEGLYSKSWLEIAGVDASFGVPTVLFDGTGSSAGAGVRIADCVKLKLSDVKMQNWTASNQYGVQALHFCELWAKNVHCATINFAGVSAEAACRLYVEGGTYNACEKGVRAAFQTHATVGYQGHPPTVTACETGFQLRNGSSCVVTGATFTSNTAYGIQLLHASESRISGTTFTTNAVGLGVHMSDWLDDLSNVNTFSGNSINVQTQLHTGELEDRNQATFDYATKFHAWGGTFTPIVKYHFRLADVATGFSSDAMMALEDDSPILQFAGDGTGTAGIYIGKTGAATQGFFVYAYTDDSWRLKVNNTEVYRWYATVFRTGSDITADLGATATRFKDLFVQRIDSTAQSQASSVSEDVVSGASSANLDIALTSSTAYVYRVSVDAEDAAGNREMVREMVKVQRSGSSAPTTPIVYRESAFPNTRFDAGTWLGYAGLVTEATVSGNNLRINVTNGMGADCHMTIRVVELSRDSTVEDS